MDRAVSPAGIIVLAEDALARDEFVCPLCRKNVYLRKINRISKAAFCHYPGEGDENCEHYHPGAMLFREVSNQKSKYLLHITLRGLVSSSPDWDLSIAIPRTKETSGTVSIISSQGMRTIPAVMLRTGRILIPVDPNLNDFTFKASNFLNKEEEQKFNITEQGLDRSCGNVFNYNESGGRKLGVDENLICGERYVAVWHKSSGLKIPSWLTNYKLNNLGHWIGAICEIPRKLSEVDNIWLNQNFRIRAKPRGYEFILRAPFEREFVDKQSFIVEKGEKIYLSLIGPYEINESQEIIVISPKNKYQKHITSNLPYTFSFLPGEVGPYRIYLKNNEKVLIDIGVDEKIRLLEPIPVQFEFETRDGLTSLPLHSKKCKDLACELSSESILLKKIGLPNELKGSLKCKPKDTVYWQEKINNTRQNHADWLVATINALAKENSSDWEYDLQSLGRISNLSDSNFVAEEVTSVSLTVSLVSTVKWLCSLLDDEHLSPKMAFSFCELFEMYEEQEFISFPAHQVSLLKRLIKVNEFPLMAIPVARELEVKIVKMLNDEKKRVVNAR